MLGEKLSEMGFLVGVGRIRDRGSFFSVLLDFDKYTDLD